MGWHCNLLRRTLCRPVRNVHPRILIRPLPELRICSHGNFKSSIFIWAQARELIALENYLNPAQSPEKSKE
jgi:hypothetical protein